MTETRNVFAIILAVMILQIAGGLLSMLTPLGLEALGTAPQFIGGIAALYATGFMLGAWTAPAALASFGNIRLFAAAAAVTSAGSIALSLWYEPGFWAIVRIVQGVSFAYMFTSVESWLGQAVPDKSRGNVMGIYHTGAKLSLMIGPFFVAGLSPLDSRAYSWAALFLTLALVPICLTQQEQPETRDRTTMPLGKLYRLAATALAAAWLGGLVIQWPAGRLSDRIERRLVIAVLSAVSGLAAMVIAIFGRSFGEIGVMLVLIVWGGGALTFYGLCVAHAIDRTPKGKIPQVMSGLLFIWAGGSIVGPLLSGIAMRAAGATGLFGLAGLLLILLAFIMVWRVSARAAPEEHQQEDWSPILPTPMASVELDPRNPEREAET